MVLRFKHHIILTKGKPSTMNYLLVLLCFSSAASAFQSPSRVSSTLQTKLAMQNEMDSRRSFFSNILSTAIVGASFSSPALAADIVAETVEMKTFVDPKGLFALNVPKRYYAIRRTVKGDLPDEKTGKGRRGSSIFTAGDLAKAEVIAVERFPTFALLADEGIDASGDLSTFPAIGDKTAIANLIALRREKDKPGSARTIVVPNSASISEDGKTLYFKLETDIDVQKPELLMEQMGVTELKRITLAKATLNSNDGQLMAVFASALQQDFNGPDGVALQEVVDSFVATDQSNATQK